MQFSLNDRRFEIDDIDFQKWIERMQAIPGSGIPQPCIIGYALEGSTPDGMGLITLSPLGRNLVLEYLISLGQLDRNELLIGAVPYCQRKHCDVIGCS